MLQHKYTNRFDAANANKQIYTPLFFRLQRPEEAEALDQLIRSHPEITIHNYLFAQIEELIKTEPANFRIGNEALLKKTEEHLNGIPADEYGVWVYYPWNNHLIHILDEEEFARVRTSRNKYKITGAEQALLGTKKVGVIGLSVGQSVSVCMAMERSFGELRIADFDSLDLSNLNRIHTGIQHLGLPKTIITAREILSHDPFLNVTLFHEGITHENIDAFFSEGGVLDAVVDECDSVDIKILCRMKASQYRVPLVMEMSDRCMVDVERYDKDPNLPMFQGGIEVPDLKQLSALTNEQKIPYMLPMVGASTISARLKASATEVGSSISTWPQLASAVVMGGGVTADVVRRILLGAPVENGRYFIDTDALIPAVTTHTTSHAPAPAFNLPVAWKQRAEALDKEKPPASHPLPPELQQLVQEAVTAPSFANIQPWFWGVQNNRLWLFEAGEKINGFYNVLGFESLMSLGACATQLVHAASRAGYTVRSVFHEGLDTVPGCVSFAFEEYNHSGVKDSIPQPYPTDLRTTSAEPLPEQAITTLQQAFSASGLDATIMHTPDTCRALSGLLAEAQRLYLLNPVAHAEYFGNLVHFDATDATEGILYYKGNTSEAELAALKLLADTEANANLSAWGLGSMHRNLALKKLLGIPAFSLVSLPGTGAHHFFETGRRLQQLRLQTEDLRLLLFPINYLTSLRLRCETGNEGTLSSGDRDAILSLYEATAKLSGLDTKKGPLLILGIAMKTKNALQDLRNPVRIY